MSDLTQVRQAVAAAEERARKSLLRSTNVMGLGRYSALEYLREELDNLIEDATPEKK
jgi:hypothetical protein